MQDQGTGSGSRVGARAPWHAVSFGQDRTRDKTGTIQPVIVARVCLPAMSAAFFSVRCPPGSLSVDVLRAKECRRGSCFHGEKWARGRRVAKLRSKDSVSKSQRAIRPLHPADARRPPRRPDGPPRRPLRRYHRNEPPVHPPLAVGCPFRALYASGTSGGETPTRARNRRNASARRAPPCYPLRRPETSPAPHRPSSDRLALSAGSINRSPSNNRFDTRA